MAEIKERPFEPREVEIMRITEADLRAVFEPCEQPDCPVCNWYAHILQPHREGSD